MELQRDFYVGIVEDNKDPNRKGRIKVRVQTLYHNLAVEDIPYAQPFAGLAGKEYQVPAIGKLVNVLFLSDDLYSPYYIYSENYNTNLRNKLKDLSEEEYVNFVALLFDERTNIFADSEELTIDHLFNKMTINNTSINHELKDNNQTLNLGSKNSEQDAVLGSNYFEWMDKFITELLNPFSLIGNTGAPILRPKLNKLCTEYLKIRSLPVRYNKGGFVSQNVKIVENTKVKKLKRQPEKVVYEKNDLQLQLDIDVNGQQCSEQLKEELLTEQKQLKKEIKKQNKNSCKQGKTAKPESHTQQTESMQKPITGTRISSPFGLRINPTNKNEVQGHNGLDIVSPEGTPIYSPADGKILEVGYDSKYGGGNFVRILHDNGLTTGYAHLKSYTVGKRSKVKKGQLIGYVGNTGGHTTGAHLHLTVTTADNEKVDPELYFDYSNLPHPSDNNNNKYQGQEYKTADKNCGDEDTQGATQSVDSEPDYNTEGSPLYSELDDDKFEEMTKLVIDKLEGGYYHPDMLTDGRIKDKRYKSSGETMFGIDRKNGGSINTSPAGQQFWKIIDNANARTEWSWLYRGGSYEEELKTLVVKMMKPRYDDFSNRYLSKEAQEIVKNDDKLLFNFIYATWNGSGWFQTFAAPINKAVIRGNTDPSTLSTIALNSRLNSSNSLIKQGGGKIQTLFNTVLA